MKYVVELILFLGWIAGVVIAKGFWSTTFALFIPFWSWYLVVEQILKQTVGGW
jgi:hypothetical protein